MSDVPMAARVDRGRAGARRALDAGRGGVVDGCATAAGMSC